MEGRSMNAEGADSRQAPAMAIPRHNAHGINVIMDKAILYAILAAFIALVPIAVVRGVGGLVGMGENANMALSIGATAIAAVAFQPVRLRVRRFANRLVYGQRVTPYEAMSSFSRRMAGALALDATLPSIAEAAAKGVGAQSSLVRLFLPGGRQEEATWPPESSPQSFDRTVKVSHQGEVVGEIAVVKTAGGRLTIQDQAALDDFASHAGIVMRNLRLTQELRHKLSELQESRRRIVCAQDFERRGMERDIHDGAQQQLVSMSVKLGLARSTLARSPEKAAEVLDDLRRDTGEVSETLRDLARGLFPPILQERGLASAIQAHVDRTGPGVLVQDELGGARFALETEANVYFVIREILRNAAEHAPGAEVSVRLVTGDGRLEFSVEDSGPGLHQNLGSDGSALKKIQDRLEALGGTLRIDSAPGAGTAVVGSVPI